MNEQDTEREVLTAEAGTVALLNRGEIDMQISTAKKWPRSIKRFRDDALAMVTLNEAIAGECFYALPRKQRDPETGRQVDVLIEGPSARFGEIVASAWGNSRAGARVVSDQGDFVTAQGVFHDLQNNVAITYEVQRRITSRSGSRFSADMIGVTANAACSIALRNAILKGVPKAFWSDLYVAARQCAMGDFKTLGNRRKDVLAELQKFGISPAKACARIGVAGIEDIGLDHLLTLRGLLTALREGDTTPEQAFAAEGAGSKEPITVPAWTDDAFSANLDRWTKAVQGGLKTVAEILAMARAKAPLTPVQEATINAIKPKPAESDPPWGDDAPATTSTATGGGK